MAGMGPPPKDPSQRRRRNASVAMTQLPAEGRHGPPPVFPLPPPRNPVTGRPVPRLAARESILWDEVWATPQAVAWERFRWAHEVALYVRFRTLAEEGDPKAASEARQWSDRLGLSPLALLRLRWEIVEDEVDEQRQGNEKDKAAPVRRLRAVDPGQQAAGDA